LYEEAKALVDAGVDGLTITNPLLCLKMKGWFPQMQVSSSVNNHLDSVERIRQAVEYLGIDRLMLDNRYARNFGFIAEVHQAFPELPIIVLVNEACLPDCVLQAYHQEHTANASRSNNDYHAPDLCRILCTQRKLQQPVYTLKAPWVRPEDLHHLFAAGASLIKLAGRTERSEWMVKLAQAYAFGRYEGDIWELIEKPGSVRPEWDEVMKKKVEHSRFKVDNQKLEGFIDPFVKGQLPCVQGKGCGSCRWCDRWMGAVTLPGNLEERLEEVGAILAEAKKGKGTAP
jgi:collagenase-like PrtC family protease